MANARKDLLLSHDMLLLTLFDDIFFLQDLEGEELVIFLASDETHLGVGSFSNDTFENEVINTNLLHLAEI